MENRITITSLNEELKTEWLSECQKETILWEIAILEERVKSYKQDIDKITLQIAECFERKDDINYDKLFRQRTKLYSLLIDIT